MKKTILRIFQTCPKTGKLIGIHKYWRWMMLLFPVVCFFALIWVLIRVIPKPNRATYPCQQVAMPLASTFLLWLTGIAGLAITFRKAQQRFHQARYIASSVCVVIGIIHVGWTVFSLQLPSFADYSSHNVNAPIGMPKGLWPGRVVWVHDPEVTDWLGPGTGQRWYDQIDQAVADDLISRALRSYAGVSNDAAAWDEIFRHHNGGYSYQLGEKIMIKVNLTTSYAGSGTANIDENYNWNPRGQLNFDSIGHSPQLMHALLDQLINVVGVNPSDITIGDPTGLWINELYIPLKEDFPNVHYLDNYGEQGRTRAEFSTVPLYWSTSEAEETQQDYIVSAYVSATYIINFAILKSHDLNGITVTAKNHFGSMLRTPTGSLRGVPGSWLELHHLLPGGSDGTPMSGSYRPIVDLNGHVSMGGKTFLYLIDGFYGGENWYSTPSKWLMLPFNDDWPSSLFISMDPVAIDSVAFDFLVEQWPGHAMMNEGIQDYLHEMALADNPPSGTYYDPERDGSNLQSMGVHEHWNNPTEKHYSRNLGTGEGLELLYVRVLASDFDSDNDVDGLNLYNFIVAYTTNAYPDADTNRDGSINSDDIEGFAQQFGLK